MSRRASPPAIGRRPIAPRASCGLAEENSLLREGCAEPAEGDEPRRCFSRRARGRLLSLL